MSLEIVNLGRRPYREIWEMQRSLFNSFVERKRAKALAEKEYILTVEHEPVITIGKHGKHSNLLINEDSLRRQGVELYDVERGGDVTYHGPGQLVVYPIIDLEKHRIGVRRYVEILEEAVIHTIARYGVEGERVVGASGVWIEAGTPRERKICALGVKCTRFVTMHGLALNVSTDLSAFGLINPCGFTDKGVTSIYRELEGRNLPLPTFDEVRDLLTENLKDLL